MMDGTAPVWQGPLLTGLFVLAAAGLTAGVAFFSLWLSDRRKLRREDQRQWDSELKQSYVTIVDQTREVYTALVVLEAASPSELGDVTVNALEAVQKEALLLELIAPKAVHEVAFALSNVLSEIYQGAFEGERQEPRPEEWRERTLQKMNGLEARLRVEIRRALRMPPN
ncbi:hypothetical protein [Curtobacterium sp. NPDC086286]|uniref:hypothetical protein n=1 Tax=Curtobacterium sp. NPDC086286 TaxID=3363964 RepID=UPI003814C115